MDTRPEAQRLAELFELESDPESQYRKAAAELRRLHSQRDALLEALKLARSVIGHPDDAHTQMIDAVIKTVEETK